MTSNYVEMLKVKKDYEDQIEDLKNLVQVSNIGESPEKEFDIYQTAEDFMKLYYGVSSEVTEEYRKENLKSLCSEEAYEKYGTTDYDNTLNYTITLSDMQIFVDYQNSTTESVYACIFYNENVDWPDINTIVLKKYWTGIFTYDYSKEKWVISDITDYQELLTREEFNSLNVDTNGSELENYEEGSSDDADTETEK
jgi:hypothetical protein